VSIELTRERADAGGLTGERRTVVHNAENDGVVV
jgi:hypothetical protein